MKKESLDRSLQQIAARTRELHMREAVEELRSKLRQFQNTVAIIEASRTYKPAPDAPGKGDMPDAVPLDPGS